MVTGHAEKLALWKMPNIEKVWEKKPEEVSVKSDRQSSARGSHVAKNSSSTQLKVLID